MQEVVIYNDRLHLIEVVSSEQVKPENLQNQLLRIRELGEIHQVKSVLIDTSKGKEIPSPIELYAFMSNLPRSFSYAILYKPNEAYIPDLEFAENVSVNRGIRVQLFSDKTDALAWLDQFRSR